MLITALTSVASSGVGGHLIHERLVDLQGIDWKLSQITEAGIAGAEVVDRKLDAPR